MQLDKVIAAVLMIGSDLPAFKALFEQVLHSFGPADQATLRQTYAEAIAAADKAHAAAQAVTGESE